MNLHFRLLQTCVILVAVLFISVDPLCAAGVDNSLPFSNPNSVSDEFATHSVWIGKRGGKKKARTRLVIESRDGENFTGVINLHGLKSGDLKLDVTGTAPASGLGSVHFKTIEAAGRFKVHFDGHLKDRIVELTYAGMGLEGQEIKGTAVLSLKEKADEEE